jgi:hypothetical protein
MFLHSDDKSAYVTRTEWNLWEDPIDSRGVKKIRKADSAMTPVFGRITDIADTVELSFGISVFTNLIGVRNKTLRTSKRLQTAVSPI